MYISLVISDAKLAWGLLGLLKVQLLVPYFLLPNSLQIEQTYDGQTLFDYTLLLWNVSNFHS